MSLEHRREALRREFDVRRERCRVDTERLEKITFEHGARMRSRPSAFGVAVACDRLPSADDIKCIVR